MADQRTRRLLVQRLAGAVVATLLILAFAWFVRTMLDHKSNKSQRVVQQVQIIRPPPPPPPDQPPPPPPEKVDTPLPKDLPEPVPDNTQAPPDQPLGLDAEGSAGGDPFGLLGRPGGTSLVGGTGTAPFGSYTNRIADAIRERIASVPCAKATKGSITVHVLMGADGSIKRVTLATTTGNKQMDQCIDTGLDNMPRLGEPLPPGMPEQVNLKIVPRI